MKNDYMFNVVLAPRRTLNDPYLFEAVGSTHSVLKALKDACRHLGIKADEMFMITVTKLRKK